MPSLTRLRPTGHQYDVLVHCSMTYCPNDYPRHQYDLLPQRLSLTPTAPCHPWHDYDLPVTNMTYWSMAVWPISPTTIPATSMTYCPNDYPWYLLVHAIPDTITTYRSPVWPTGPWQYDLLPQRLSPPPVLLTGPRQHDLLPQRLSPPPVWPTGPWQYDLLSLPPTGPWHYGLLHQRPPVWPTGPDLLLHPIPVWVHGSVAYRPGGSHWSPSWRGGTVRIPLAPGLCVRPQPAGRLGSIPSSTSWCSHPLITWPNPRSLLT